MAESALARPSTAHGRRREDRAVENAKLLQTGASIMANEGQHLVVLRRIAGKDPIPNAFETGAQ